MECYDVEGKTERAHFICTFAWCNGSGQVKVTSHIHKENVLLRNYRKWRFTQHFTADLYYAYSNYSFRSHLTSLQLSKCQSEGVGSDGIGYITYIYIAYQISETFPRSK